jgi:hypothetical protein
MSSKKQERFWRPHKPGNRHQEIPDFPLTAWRAGTRDAKPQAENHKALNRQG